MVEKAIQNTGDLKLISNVFQKAKAGSQICIAFIGGSITVGDASKTPESSYAYLVYNWWKNQFPQSQFSYLNAGIGATCSNFGLARVKRDVLSKKPDLIFVEYSVNDQGNNHYKESYEGLLRIILKSSWDIAVILINCVRYDTGDNAQDYHNPVGKYYNLPIISMKNSIYDEIKKGNIKRKDITFDDLHPNDQGHRLMADIIIGYLEKSLSIGDKGGKRKKILKKPLTNNGYEDAILYQNDNSFPQLEGFQSDKRPQDGIRDVFKKGWYARQVGDKIRFDILGGNIGIQYRKSVTRKAPIAYAYIDGDRQNRIKLDGNFQEDWGDYLSLTYILKDGAAIEHTIEIEIDEIPKDCEVDFYLVSVIASKRHGI